MIKYEYKTINLTSWRNEHNITDERLTEFGMAGWELVSTYTYEDGIIKGIFKRQIT
jgi:hypothetical protein